MEKRNELQERLFKLPEAITLKELDILRTSEEVDQVKVMMERCESQHMWNITSCTEDNGKPIFTNETSRKAEFANRIRSDEEYEQYNSHLMRLQHDQAMRKIELNLLHNQFSAIKAVLQSGVQE